MCFFDPLLGPGGGAMHKRVWRLHSGWGRWLINTYINLQIVQLQTVTSIRKENQEMGWTVWGEGLLLMRWSGKASLRS